MIHLETALEKASEDPQKLEKLIKDISTKIVKVYTSVANEHQEAGNFGEALQYFEKCQDVAKRAHDEVSEADCYQQIGLIYHLLGHFDESIEYTTKFRQLCENHQSKCRNETEIKENAEKRISAHKQLAETYVTNPNMLSMAIQELQNVINVATKIESKQQQAEACHKLGLLFNMQSKDRDPKKSLQFL